MPRKRKKGTKKSVAPKSKGRGAHICAPVNSFSIEEEHCIDVEKVSKELQFEESGKTCDNSYDLAMKSIFSEESPGMSLQVEPLIPAFQIKQEPADDYQDYSASAAPQISSHTDIVIPFKVKQEPVSDDDTIEDPEIMFLHQTVNHTSPSIPFAIKQEKECCEQNSDLGRPECSKSIEDFPLLTKIKQEPKDDEANSKLVLSRCSSIVHSTSNEHVFQSDPAAMSFPSSSTPPVKELPKVTSFAGVLKMGNHCNSFSPTIDEVSGSISTDAKESDLQVDRLGVRIKQELLETVKQSVPVSNYVSTISMDSAVVTGAVPPTPVTTPTNFVVSSATANNLQKTTSSEAQFRIVDNCFVSRTSSEDKVLPSDSIFLTKIKQEPPDTFPSTEQSTTGLTQDVALKQDIKREKFDDTNPLVCPAQLDESISAHSGNISLNGLSVTDVISLPTCSVQPYVDENIQAKSYSESNTEIIKVEAPQIPSYSDALNFMGINWTKIIDLSEHENGLGLDNKEHSSTIQVIVPSVQEMEMYLSISVDLPEELRCNMGVITDHFIKNRRLAPRCFPPNLPLPKKLSVSTSHIAPSAVMNYDDSQNPVSSNQHVLNEERQAAAVLMWPDKHQGATNQTWQTLNNQALPEKNGPNTANSIPLPSIETLRSILNTVNPTTVTPACPLSSPQATPEMQCTTSNNFVLSNSMVNSLPETGIDVDLRIQSTGPQEKNSGVTDAVFSNSVLQDILISTRPVSPESKNKDVQDSRPSADIPDTSLSRKDSLVTPESWSRKPSHPFSKTDLKISLARCDSKTSTALNVNSEISARRDNNVDGARNSNPEKQTADDSSASKKEESPMKKKSRYEIIMERKERDEVPKTVKRPFEPDHQVKDPRLASLRQRIQQGKKSIPVINPLPIENNVPNKKPKKTDKESALLKKTRDTSPVEMKGASRVKRLRSNEVEGNDSSRKYDRRRRQTSESDEETDVQNTDESRGTRNGTRFSYRGGFLAQDQSLEKKTRPEVKRGKQNETGRAQKNRILTIEELHATVDIPSVVNSQLDAINYPAARRVDPNDHWHYANSFQTHIPSSSSHYSNSHSSFQQRDPRLNRGNMPSDTSNQGMRSQQNNNPSGYGLPNSRSSHVQPQNVLSDWRYMSPQSSSSVVYNSRKSVQNSSALLQNNSMMSAPFRSYQPLTYEAENYRSFVPPLPPPDHLQPSQPLSPSDASDICSDSPTSTHSDNARNMHVTPPLSHNFGRQVLPSQAHENFSAAHKRNHTPFLRKDVSLLPAPLKNAVGIKILTSTEVLIIMLSWNSEWLVEQGKIPNLPPPIYKHINPVRWAYPNLTEYFNTYLPMLLIETWQRIYHEWKTVLRNNNSFIFVGIEGMKAKGDMIEIECSCEIRKRDGVYPLEGNLVLLKFFDDSENIKIFGYVSSHVFTCGSHNSQNPLSTEDVQTLHLCVKIIYRLQSSVMKTKMQVLTVYNLKTSLRQIDALRGVDMSPLYQTILHPQVPECNKVVIERVKATSASSISRAVEQIMGGIMLDDPAPRISVVEAQFGTDLLIVLVAVVEHIKSLVKDGDYARILVCCRSIGRLKEIGVRLLPSADSEPNERIETVILTKPDTMNYPELRRLTLDEVVLNHMQVLKENPTADDVNEKESSALSHVLKKCDVLLSIVTNCHESSIHQVLGPKSDTPLTFCIIDEVHMCTEPETLVPMLYGIKKFVFFGDPQVKPNPRTKLTKDYGFKQNLVARVCKAVG